VLFFEFLQRNYRSEFFCNLIEIAGLNGAIRGLRGASTTAFGLSTQIIGTPGRVAPLIWCRPMRGHPTEHAELKAITRLRDRAHDALTTRERQLVLVLSEGVTNKEIGRRLSVAEGTVKVHLHRIYRKIGIANRTALAIRASNQTL